MRLPVVRVHVASDAPVRPHLGERHRHLGVVVREGEQLRLLASANDLLDFHCVKQGNLVAVGTHRGLVQVWDVAASRRISELSGHDARVGALAWNGDTLSSGSRDRAILQRDIRVPPQVAERKLVRSGLLLNCTEVLNGAFNGTLQISHRQEVCGLKWSPDGQYLASGGNDNKLFVWNLSSLQPVHSFTEHIAAVKAIAWSPHHHGLLASGGEI